MANRPIIIRALTAVEGLVLYVDGFPNQQPKLTTRTGEEPLEDGRQVTDHAVAQAPVVVLTGSVSDIPGARRPTRAFERIFAMWQGVEPVRVVTEWHTYDEMLITRFEPRPTGRGMRFEMEVREVLRVRTTVEPDTPSSALSGPAVGRTGEVTRGRLPLAASFAGVPIGTSLAVARGQLPLSTLTV